MKVIFDRNTLIEALIPASSIAPSKNTIASIEGILFECPGEVEGTCRLSAFDLEKGLRTTIPARIIEKGKYVLNAQNILQIVRSLSDGDIVLSIDDNNRASISNGTSIFEISATSGDDFPVLPLLTGDKYYTLPQYVFRKMINGILFAVAQNDTKPALNGAFFKCENGTIQLVGCDRNRLAISQLDTVHNEKFEDCEVIIPGKILGEVAKVIKDSDDDITIIMARKHVIFTIGHICMFSRIIDVQYMDFQRFLPDSCEIEAYLGLDDLKGAIDRASLITEDKLGGKSTKAHVKLEFSGDHLDVSSISVGGKSFESLPCAKTGSDLLIGFNCKYLSDILHFCPDSMKTLKLKLNNAVMGMVIENGTLSEKKEDEYKTNFTYFVMPIRM